MQTDVDIVRLKLKDKVALPPLIVTDDPILTLCADEMIGTGSIEFGVVGGVAQYTYTLVDDSGAEVAKNTIPNSGANIPPIGNLAAGTYTLTIIDQNNTEEERDLIITSPSVIVASLTMDQDYNCSTDTKAVISASEKTMMNLSLRLPKEIYHSNIQ